MADVKIDVDKCTGCGTCVDTCPVGVYEIRDGKSVVVKISECLACKACEAQCPSTCIEVTE